jgi:hypothetical protein
MGTDTVVYVLGLGIAILCLAITLHLKAIGLI